MEYKNVFFCKRGGILIVIEVLVKFYKGVLKIVLKSVVWVIDVCFRKNLGKRYLRIRFEVWENWVLRWRKDKLE